MDQIAEAIEGIDYKSALANTGGDVIAQRHHALCRGLALEGTAIRALQVARRCGGVS